VFEPKVLLLDEPLSDLDDGRFNVDVSAFAGYAIGGQVSVIVLGAAWAAPKEAASVAEALV
jgi:ABC-type molybdenum transport system ATPase subunit/photorepair protein PhrA